MSGSFFDDLFAGAPRTILDGAFGQPWTVLPQYKPTANSPGAADPSRPVVENLVGYFSDKVEPFKATHVYDPQADKRPGMTTSETRVEFPDATAEGPLDLRGGDFVVRAADGSRWRISSIEHDLVTNRFTCVLARLS